MIEYLIGFGYIDIVYIGVNFEFDIDFYIFINWWFGFEKVFVKVGFFLNYVFFEFVDFMVEGGYCVVK